ncbi:MAG TPA: hypothetical protein VE999_19985 [Gemmataceae bacterium]|nr:hypothetical protein [Gemmataceae bacterium]
MSESTVLVFALIGFGLLVILLFGIGAAVHVWWASRQENRRAEREAALKKEMLDRGLSVDEIERVIRATAEQPKQPISDEDEKEVAGEFGALLVSCKPGTIEEVFVLFKAADLATRRAMVSAISQMRDQLASEVTDEQVRAVVRGLARPAETSPESAPSANDLPRFTGTASRISDAFHLPE